MILLMDLERYNDIQNLAKRASKVEAVDKSWIQHRLGLVEELQLHFQEAINLYEKAILLTLNDDKIKGYKEDITRCEEKRELLLKHTKNQ
jgi:hypothetical protein